MDTSLDISTNPIHKALFLHRKEVDNIINSSKLSKDNVLTIKSHLDKLTEVVTGLLVSNT